MEPWQSDQKLLCLKECLFHLEQYLVQQQGYYNLCPERNSSEVVLTDRSSVIWHPRSLVMDNPIIFESQSIYSMQFQLVRFCHNAIGSSGIQIRCFYHTKKRQLVHSIVVANRKMFLLTNLSILLQRKDCWFSSIHHIECSKGLLGTRDIRELERLHKDLDLHNQDAYVNLLGTILVPLAMVLALALALVLVLALVQVLALVLVQKDQEHKIVSN